MDARDSMQSLLVLRKLTRAMTDVVRAQMTEYLATLAPLLRPSLVLGDYVGGGAKESTRRADKAFKELQASYEQVAVSKPFTLPRDLTPPLRIVGNGLDITPVDYPHTVPDGANARTIMVRSPLTWTLSYSGYAPNRLAGLVRSKVAPSDEVTEVVLSYLILNVVVNHSPGLRQIFDALHFPITTVTVPEFGALPVTRIGAALSTARPADDVVLQTAELTGIDAFEEVVNVGDIARLEDPLKDRLRELADQHAPGLR